MIALKSPFTYKGYDVLTYLPNADGPRTDALHRISAKVEGTVPGLVRIRAYRDDALPTYALTFRCIDGNGGTARELRALLRTFAEDHITAGTAFWLPTFAQDFEVLTKPSTYVWTVRASGFATLFTDQPPQYLLGYASMSAKQGAYKVASVSLSGDVETITASSSGGDLAGDWSTIGTTVPDCLSHLRLARFEPVIDEEWFSTAALDITLTAVLVPAEEP